MFPRNNFSDSDHILRRTSAGSFHKANGPRGPTVFAVMPDQSQEFFRFRKIFENFAPQSRGTSMRFRAIRPNRSRPYATTRARPAMANDVACGQRV
jgi:hypothetical protein